MSEQRNYHPHTPPHKTLGKHLKSLRQKFQESLGETSGSVEILVEQLDRFERGAELPSEDILLLLISHFGLQDDEAVELWDIAGYDQDSEKENGFANARAAKNDRHEHHENSSHFDENQLRQVAPIMLLALDNRVLYSNGVEVVSDDAGMVLNFMQSAETQQQRYPISRVGMSHDQAEQLLQVLQRALLHKKYLSGPKHLPPPKI